MRRAVPFHPSPASPRLATRNRGDRTELWTEAVGAPPSVYGERWASADGRAYRAFEPARSKLAAGIDRGWDGPLPRPGERWLYLGAASGTTASHVADLVGPRGRVYAVERSVRPFVRLLAVAERWPSLVPVLADARSPEAYADLVPIVDGLYADVAQADQAELVRANAAVYLDDSHGAVVVALKTSTMGRTGSAPEHLRSAARALSDVAPLAPAVRLGPFFRSHFLLGGHRGAPGRADATDRTAGRTAPRFRRPSRR